MINPLVVFFNADDSSVHKASANASIYPNLGLLTLMSSLKAKLTKYELNVELAYLDGTVVGNSVIEDFLLTNSSRVFAACGSTLTANYGATLKAFSLLKVKNPASLTILGNDHFSALDKTILKNRPVVDFGFSGNDVVLGFTNFIIDGLLRRELTLGEYAGLVYREGDEIVKNAEDPSEFQHLSLIDYKLMNFPFDHINKYLEGQKRTYLFMRESGLQSMVVDLGRGCIKFGGARDEGIPINACDFCAIIPGSKAISSQSATRAWEILENCFRSGFNYFYVTADELPLTFWPMLRDMAASPPAWYLALVESDRPRMFGYARAEAFAKAPERIDTLVDQLRFNHFFIGFDGLSEISLRVMNKQPVGQGEHNLVWHNMTALNRSVSKKCLITGGIVLTHLGITREIMSSNYTQLERNVSQFPHAFAALDFGPLCPIPGSMAFRYLTNPEFAVQRAKQFGLRVNREFLDSVAGHYRTGDIFDMGQLVKDFVNGCCPDISMDDLGETIQKTTELAQHYEIVVGGGV